MAGLEEQYRPAGEKIAAELNVYYNGPWMFNEEFIGHTFTDKEVTGTTFVCKDLEDCRAKLQEKRNAFAAEKGFTRRKMTGEMVKQMRKRGVLPPLPPYLPQTSEIRIGDPVRSPHFGEGEVVRVLFDSTATAKDGSLGDMFITVNFAGDRKTLRLSFAGLEKITPPVEERAGYAYHGPMSLTQEEYQRVWKPDGWNLLIIGPTSTWREEWGPWEAIRDIVQNCLDESESYESGYDNEGLWIADQGKGVAVADFLLGPPKLKPDWARGKFGEGMKIAALAMVRAGYPVRVETRSKELWMVFLEQPTGNHQMAKSLSALWRPQENKDFRWGTQFHFIGYHGSDYKYRFAINIPPQATIIRAPSYLESPLKRFNQVIDFVYPHEERGLGDVEGSRIFARDIYLRTINSPYSYNLWGFDLAPDRHGPKSEDDVWLDIGRTWACCTDPKLLDIFFQMCGQPPLLLTDESNHLTMDLWRFGRPPDTALSYAGIMEENHELWFDAFKRQYGDSAVLRTSDRWDNTVKHLGYEPVSMGWATEGAMKKVIFTDTALIDQSQERLREVEILDDRDLAPEAIASLDLARAIARQNEGVRIVRVHAAIIPPASERARTAGMYGTTTREIYLNVDQLAHGRSTVDTTIHELAHHRSGAEDLEEPHAAMMTQLAGRVVEDTAKGAYDEWLRNPSFVW